MCLAIPRRVLRVEGRLAVVDVDGEHREARLEAVEEPVSAGDWVVEHAGFVLHRVPDDEVQGTLELFAQLLGGRAAS